MTATGSNARSSLIVQLSPTRSAKLSFAVQLGLTLLWLGWAVMLLVFNREGEQNFLYYIFLGLAVAFLGYVVLQNTSIFGVQSYIEVTPQYIVYKRGVFRPKHIISIPEIEALHISALALRISGSNGSNTYLDLKQVRKKKDLEKIKSKIRTIATANALPLTEHPTKR
ncbi:hypothetical protein [Pontibacter arcticus]|uniref:DUF304 domain-containing protein n=1 Tax=Pontibacter arcticus TaxID=2080288 RepID=A0A364RJK5_9BACT|nr:hypothetical protein [Pontibacter arcticus]RAU84472.1 hypothetical protein DP923_00910 [Pontibacter arcticus]